MPLGILVLSPIFKLNGVSQSTETIVVGIGVAAIVGCGVASIVAVAAIVGVAVGWLVEVQPRNNRDTINNANNFFIFSITQEFYHLFRSSLF